MSGPPQVLGCMQRAGPQLWARCRGTLDVWAGFWGVCCQSTLPAGLLPGGTGLQPEPQPLGRRVSEQQLTRDTPNSHLMLISKEGGILGWPLALLKCLVSEDCFLICQEEVRIAPAPWAPLTVTPLGSPRSPIVRRVALSWGASQDVTLDPHARTQGKGRDCHRRDEAVASHALVAAWSPGEAPGRD